MSVCGEKRTIIRGSSRKGSYMVEAAVVFPVIIVTVITAVLIIMFFYSQTAEQCRMHVTMRREAGLCTGKTIYTYTFGSRDGTDAEIYADKTLTGSKVYGKKYLIMPYRGVLEKKGISVIEGECCGTDGARYMRYCSFVKGKDDE